MPIFSPTLENILIWWIILVQVLGLKSRSKIYTVSVVPI